jgi:hypothetical protein
LKNGIFLYLAVFAVITACSSQKNSELDDPPIITSATYQHTLFNGKSQGIDARAEKEDAPITVTYYLSEADYDADINAFTEAPTEPGLYYARIRRPEGNGYKQGRDIKVEYHIQKPLAPVDAVNKGSSKTSVLKLAQAANGENMMAKIAGSGNPSGRYHVSV